MATLTITLPDRTNEWMEERARADGYDTVSAYLSHLVERERSSTSTAGMEWPDQPALSLEELRRIVEDARAGGSSGKSLSEIIEEGNRIAKADGFYRE